MGAQKVRKELRGWVRENANRNVEDGPDNPTLEERGMGIIWEDRWGSYNYLGARPTRKKAT